MTERALGIAGFFGELERRVDGARRSDHARYQQFFVELNPILDAVRKLDRELDRHLARRFNVFDYMGQDRPTEALLSRIVADLLNPEARHGQGASLLRTLLDKLALERGLPKPGPDFTKPVNVKLERHIPKDRRIDITVDFATEQGPWCLAVENKPYAGDQPRQVIDYLEYLKKEYGDRFLLIFLSPRGSGPSENSLPQRELSQWCGRFAVMPYWVDPGTAETEADSARDEGSLREDVFAHYRTEFSLADWFAACRAQCEAERLRWFLRDAEVFCRQRFGGHSMATDGDAGTIRDFLFSNPNHLITAQAVWDVWPEVKEAVCRGFLEHLRKEVHGKVHKELSGIAPDLRVECKYVGERRWSNFLWLYREEWPLWKNHTNIPPYEGCTGIVMQSEGPGPNSWKWGVLHPLDQSNMTEMDKARRTCLEERLRSRLDLGGSESWWPYVRSVSDEMVNWNSLLPDLCQEWKDRGGPITEYYVTGIMDLATKAIPVIDEVERKR